MSVSANKETMFRAEALRDCAIRVLDESNKDPLMISRKSEILQIIDLVTKSVNADAEESSRLLSQAVELAKPFADKCMCVDDLLTEAYGFMMFTKAKIF